MTLTLCSSCDSGQILDAQHRYSHCTPPPSRPGLCRRSFALGGGPPLGVLLSSYRSPGSLSQKTFVDGNGGCRLVIVVPSSSFPCFVLQVGPRGADLNIACRPSNIPAADSRQGRVAGLICNKASLFAPASPRSASRQQRARRHVPQEQRRRRARQVKAAGQAAVQEPGVRSDPRYRRYLRRAAGGRTL